MERPLRNNRLALILLHLLGEGDRRAAGLVAGAGVSGAGCADGVFAGASCACGGSMASARFICSNRTEAHA